MAKTNFVTEEIILSGSNGFVILPLYCAIQMFENFIQGVSYIVFQELKA